MSLPDAPPRNKKKDFFLPFFLDLSLPFGNMEIDNSFWASALGSDEDTIP
jgi:hypothetical protein